MFSENFLKTQKKMKDFQLIMFVDLPVDITADKEGEKVQSSLEISCGTSEQLLAKNSFEEFQYLRGETFHKAKNLAPYLKQHSLHDYRCPVWIREHN